MARPHQKVVIDDAVKPRRMIRSNNHLPPNMRRIASNDQPRLLPKLTPQRRQPILPSLDAATWSRPHSRRPPRHRRMWKDEPAQQNSIILIKEDRASRTAQVQLHGSTLGRRQRPARESPPNEGILPD